MDSTHLAKSCLISASYRESIWIPATQLQYMKHAGCWMETLDQELDCMPNAGSSDLIVLFNVQYSVETTAMKVTQASDVTEHIFTL